ncbi:MAG TPA: carboxylesterase/lipase family protein [Kofleriaceae bacterium]
MSKVVALALALVACRSGERAEPKPSPVAPQPVGPRAQGCPSDAVMTTGGCVRGSATAYLGIPYAAPPIGALRWKLPQPVITWPGVRDATAFGRACPQLDSPLAKLAWNEDCLTLNVWTKSRTGKRPVMVWIHGGGLAQGGSAVPLYDGQHLAAGGDVVLVSANYRLGALGFLAHAALVAEDTAHHAAGNYGLHDQVAALQWVKRDIAAFGGDPTNVTIFGESAGAMSVCALMASPLARGLFAKAVIQSGACVDHGKKLRALGAAVGRSERAEDQGARVVKALGCTGADALACMRGKRVEDILQALPAALGFLGKGEHFGFTVDRWAIPDSLAAMLGRGELANVPVMIGTTADEATLFTSKLRLARPAGYRMIVRRLFADATDRVLASYPPAPTPKQAFDTLVTDVVFTCPTRRAARALRERAPVYRFLFSHVTAGARAKGLGATHGSEIAFVFGTVATPTEDERALSRAMLGYWTRFARTGDPNAAGAPSWPVYDAGADSYLELGPIRARSGLRTVGCDLLDTLAPGEPDVEDP